MSHGGKENSHESAGTGEKILDEKIEQGGEEMKKVGGEEETPRPERQDIVGDKAKTDQPVEEIEAAVGEPGHHGGKDSTRKRSKKGKSKDLVDLLQKKNEILQGLKQELEKANEEIAVKEDRLLRVAAEFENYKKRTRREWELLQKKANADLISDILGVLDDFGRAFDAAEDGGEHFLNGMMLIYSGLLDILRKSGLKEIEAEGKVFDPQYHEAMGETETDGVDAGCIAYVVQKGYLLHDQVLRPARVIVAGRKKERDTDRPDGGDA